MDDGEGGQRLAQRRTYGGGLDEIVRLESDIDGDGSLETVVTPLYDSTGNLVAATNASGKTIERYEYSPYGERRISSPRTSSRYGCGVRRCGWRSGTECCLGHCRRRCRTLR
ncbi:MAG: hypothetical protein WBO54_01825 [Thermoanaerobaculia bacterium]